MREVKPTQKPVPSSDIKDLFFNSGLLDIWATSLERKYIDRFGNCHLTSAGMEWLFNELVDKFKVDMNIAIVAAGYITIDSFQQGADLPNNELTQRNHILRDETTGEYYRWDGDLPKQVTAGSTPQSTGGIGKDAWISVGDASLRSDIKNADGASLIGSTNYGGVRAYRGNNRKINVYGRESILDGADGLFILDEDDNESIDNDGTVLVDSLNRRWKRQFSGDVNVIWFTGSGENVDAGIGFQKCVNAYPNSKIIVPKNFGDYYFDTQVVEPPSASYQLVSVDIGIQNHQQQLLYARTNGAVFYCPPSNTTFTKYEGFRFSSNKDAYPSARAIHNEGFWVHGEAKSITVHNFKLKAIEINGSNCCNYEQIMPQFCDDYGVYVHIGAANTFNKIIGDNNDGGVLWVNGASNVFTALYSEDCCKLNVSEGRTDAEFVFLGDAPVVNGLIINSYAGNSTPPISLDICRNFTGIGIVNKSTVAPSYEFDVKLSSSDSSCTLINSTGIRVGGSVGNSIVIDSGYSTVSVPTLMSGGYKREIASLLKNTPIAWVSFNGVNGAIYQGSGIASISMLSTGQFKVTLSQDVGYKDGMSISGTASTNETTPVLVTEVEGSRTENSFRVVIQNATSGAGYNSPHVSIQVFGMH